MATFADNVRAAQNSSVEEMVAECLLVMREDILFAAMQGETKFNFAYLVGIRRPFTQLAIAKAIDRIVAEDPAFFNSGGLWIHWSDWSAD